MGRPNVVFILIDDMGWMDIGCYGSSFYETPNLDRLCGEGMRFTDAYASCPVCSPTRASILTGRYPARVGVTEWIGGHAVGKLIGASYLDHLPLEEHTIASALRDGGYRTYHVGKWHLGGEPFWPEKQGFDVNIGGCEWGCPYKGYFDPYGIPTLPSHQPGEYLTDRLTDEAIRLLRGNGDDPFFLYLPYYAVHTPIQAPPDDIPYFEEKARRTGLDDEQTFEVDGQFPCWHKRHLRITRRLVQSDAGLRRHDQAPGLEHRPTAGRAGPDGQGRGHHRRLHQRQRRTGHRRRLTHLQRAARRGQGLDVRGRHARMPAGAVAGPRRAGQRLRHARHQPGLLPDPPGSGGPEPDPRAALRRRQPDAAAGRGERPRPRGHLLALPALLATRAARPAAPCARATGS